MLTTVLTVLGTAVALTVLVLMALSSALPDIWEAFQSR
ncbi:hypothetical protein SAMN04489718_3387 [Actinopolyspora saharensis]|uniref:Uncharacterized protein n=1 Tax=Actinopolyspora saharensis TaxID=995062 RepID=A0A1H1G3N6_9ACTN|nr:hypothetical protein SAMN04489718_3387 [Actinopolyspora saharensis]